MMQLNSKQREVIECVASGKSIFMTGLAGTGKSMLLKMIQRDFGSRKTIALTSTTGTSALLIGGTTLHSYLGIGLAADTAENLSAMICSKSWIKLKWCKLNILIIDEISMMPPELFDKLEAIARSIRKNKLPFGGIQLVLSGDFCQLPPVASTSFCFESETWKLCVDKSILLTEVYRQTDPLFQSVLEKVRISDLTDDVIEALDARLGVKLSNDTGVEPTKLFSLNQNVEIVNEKELDKLASDGREFIEYEIRFKIIKRDYDLERLKKKIMSVSPIVQICVGAQVMLLTNMDLQAGLCNGSRGVVESFIEGIPVVRFRNNEVRTIGYYSWDVQEEGKVVATYTQIPLKVAYAMSIHKSQGCSLDCVEIDLSSVFEYGQVYVALSRVKTLEGLSLMGINYDKIQTHPKAIEFYKNIE